LPRVLRGVLQRGEEGDEAEAVDGLRPGLEKTRVFYKKKSSPVVFFGFYSFFLCFLFFLYICPIEFLGFFQFQEYF
jgi:hypothetical protein